MKKIILLSITTICFSCQNISQNNFSDKDNKRIDYIVSGDTLFYRKDYKQSIEMYKKALELNYFEKSVHLKLMHIYSLRKEQLNVLKTFLDYIKIYPEGDLQYFLLLSSVEEIIKDTDYSRLNEPKVYLDLLLKIYEVLNDKVKLFTSSYKEEKIDTKDSIFNINLNILNNLSLEKFYLEKTINFQYFLIKYLINKNYPFILIDNIYTDYMDFSKKLNKQNSKLDELKRDIYNYTNSLIYQNVLNTDYINTNKLINLSLKYKIYSLKNFDLLDTIYSQYNYTPEEKLKVYLKEFENNKLLYLSETKQTEQEIKLFIYYKILFSLNNTTKNNNYEKFLKMFISIYPEEIELYKYLFYYYSEKNMKDDSIKISEKIISLTEIKGDYNLLKNEYLSISNLYKRYDDYENSLKYMLKVINYSKDEYLNAASLSKYFKDYNRMIYFLEKHLELNPNDSNVYNEFANYYLSIGETDKALKYFNSIPKLYENKKDKNN